MMRVAPLLSVMRVAHRSDEDTPEDPPRDWSHAHPGPFSVGDRRHCGESVCNRPAFRGICTASRRGAIG